MRDASTRSGAKAGLPAFLGYTCGALFALATACILIEVRSLAGGAREEWLKIVGRSRTVVRGWAE
ncbi:hypothetical protein CR492_10380 [Methylocella silvestris]|uniref:Uncharacterized protein n=1 Tax=Methylocella silvestris TaxID=199596 RepID=A0A2J7TGT7_METSI|nr:hypothetical protein CR492_10380 [Methylocella silvestris]